jgi:hypothetical protein
MANAPTFITDAILNNKLALILLAIIIFVLFVLSWIRSLNKNSGGIIVLRKP